MRVERLQSLGIDARIISDAARQVYAHEPEPVDGVVHDFDRNTRILQRDRRAGPQPARIFALRAGHFLVPGDGVVASFLDWHIGEGDRERPDGADHVDIVSEPVHVFKLLVEIEPFGPAVEMLSTARAPHVVVAALPVDLGTGIFLAPAKLVENGSGPPMEMRVNDVHGYPCGTKYIRYQVSGLRCHLTPDY